MKTSLDEIPDKPQSTRALFPDIRLDQVLQFEDDTLLGLRSAKPWQDPASPAWLGATLCALAGAIGPMARLFLPDGNTVSPTFNVILGLDPNGKMGFYRKILDPIRKLQNRLRKTGAARNTFLGSTLEWDGLNYLYRQSANGLVLIVDERAPLLHRYDDLSAEDQVELAALLSKHSLPVFSNHLRKPNWEGSVNTLLTCDRHRLPNLETTPLFQNDSPPRILVLPEDFVHQDISVGHEFGFKELEPWTSLVHAVTGWPNLWASDKMIEIGCAPGAIPPLEELREELRDLTKVVADSYQPFLNWLPDLAASLSITIEFLEGRSTSIKPAVTKSSMEHATVITRWLANCHFKGLQEILQVDPVPDASDKPVIPDRPSLILEKLREKGPMTRREISRSCYRMTASARDHALKWLHDRDFVVFREGGLVLPVN